MRRPASLLCTLAVTTLVATTSLTVPAWSQTSLEDPLDARDAKRLDRMEKVMRELRAIVFKSQENKGVPIVVQPADTDARIDELSRRIGDLEQTLTRMNGTLETVTHDLDQAKRDNAGLRDQVKAMGDKLTSLEAPPPPPPPTEAAAPPPAASPAEAFAAARKLMLSGDYDAAEAAFADYVAAYPDAPKTPEARYWWGKTLTVKNAHGQAAAAYIGAIRGWPQTSWAPDATVELSRSLIALKKPTEACQALAEFDKRYPKAPAAVVARAANARTQAKCS